MKQATRDWIDKAEDDLRLARQSLATSVPVFDGISYHAQQCVEKYLKAVLQEHNVRHRRTHDLADLAMASRDLIPEILDFSTDFRWLTTLATDTRYPGSQATENDANRAMQIATNVRSAVRASLGLTE